MKEIREIKMVEQVNVKFVANDGREFIGENAQQECEAYERRCNRDKVVEAYNRLDVKEIEMSVVEWWYGDYSRLWKITLESKKDYYAFVDYLIVEMGIYKGDMNFEEPKEYPYTTLVGAGCEWAYEYGTADQMKEKLQKMIEQLG